MQQMVVLADLRRIDPPAARHAEMEDHRVAAIGVDQPIFGAPAEAGDPRAGQPLAQIGRERPAQVGAARLDARDAGGPSSTRLKPADGGFDFGQLRHGSRDMASAAPQAPARGARR